MHRRGSIVVAVLCAHLVVPAAAQADVAAPVPEGPAPQLLPSVSSTLVAPAARRLDCRTAPRSGRSVAHTHFTAPADGTLTARLRGRGDWDLAAFDARGRRLGGSAGFGATEVVQVRLHAREVADLQGCRRSGGGSRVSLQTVFAKHSPVAPQLPRRSLVKVHITGGDDVRRLEALGLDVTHDVRPGSANVILHGVEQLAKLRATGFLFRTLIPDLGAHNRAARTRERAYAERVGVSPLPSGRTDYRQFEDIQADLKRLVEQYPGHVRPFHLPGTTSEGRELPAVEIAANVGAPLDGRPYFVLNAMHHAREWPAAETPVEFAFDLAQGYGRDARITKLLEGVRVIVMPVTNADGFVASRGGGQQEYRRRNCNYPFRSPGTPCEFQQGVDPNRNYGYKWGGPGASDNPADDTFRGPGPFSEPEVQITRQLVSRTVPTSLLTIHNVAALVLRPPGLQEDGMAPDEERLRVLGELMAHATGYPNQFGWQLYDTSGTTDDWSYAATGGYGYTIEIGPTNGDFHEAYDVGVVKEYTGDVPGAAGGLREAYLLAAEAARNPLDTSRIAGRAPAGRTLRLTKAFTTETYAVCAESTATYCSGQTQPIALDEKLETTLVVPASGRFEWWLPPSTRPYVRREGRTEAFTITCEDGGRAVETHAVTVDRGQTASLDLPCGGTLVSNAAPARKSPASKKKKAKRKKPSCKTKKAKRTKRCRRLAKKRRAQVRRRG